VPNARQFQFKELFMSTMQTALKDVVYKPTKGERAMSLHNLEIIRLAEFNRAFDGVVASPIKPRKIQFEKAGSHVRARYQGDKTFVIGYDKWDAASRLRTWAGKRRYE
jgi:hypothetical protein